MPPILLHEEFRKRRPNGRNYVCWASSGRGLSTERHFGSLWTLRISVFLVAVTARPLVGEDEKNGQT